MDLRERVEKRLNELGISAWKAAKNAGLHGQYISDLLHGKKDRFNPNQLPIVAKALQCDIAYVSHADQLPPKVVITPPGMPVLGICETGVWRDQNAPSAHQPAIELAPDVRNADAPQVAYLLQGSPFVQHQNSRAFAVCVDGQHIVSRLHDGCLVVTRRQQGDLVELALKRCQLSGRGYDLHPAEFDGSPPDPIRKADKKLALADGKIVALVLLVTFFVT